MEEFEKLSEEMKNIVLTHKERATLRGFILNFMKSGPVRAESVLRLTLQRSIISLRQSLQLFIKKPMPIILILALILGGSGVSFAAENALPGDLLYPVKLNVNEEVVATLSISPEAKANWETRRAERRLEEAEELAAKGELKPEVREQIEQNFERHAQRVGARIEEFKARDLKVAADLSSNFEVSLKSHALILVNLIAATSTSATSTDTASTTAREMGRLLIKVRSRDKDASELRIEIENRVASSTPPNVESAALNKLKAAENKIDEVQNFIGKMRQRLGAEATSQAEARLKMAEDKLAVGKVKLEAKAYGEAFRIFQEASRVAQEAKLLLQARGELKLRLKLDGAALSTASTTSRTDDDELNFHKRGR